MGQGSPWSCTAVRETSQNTAAGGQRKSRQRHQLAAGQDRRNFPDEPHQHYPSPSKHTPKIVHQIEKAFFKL